MSFRLFSARAALVAVLLAASFSGSLPAQAYAPRDSVTVVPGAAYKAGGLHRLFFGTHYRKLWTTPIRVPVLHLSEFAGGLKPSQKGGGQQTRSLRFDGADGREYQFRSVSKDASVILPPELRRTVAADIVQDQMSSGHPAGALVVAPILDAAGVLNTRPILVQMPDDPALGEFRKEFAGLLGTIEERPRTLALGGTTFPQASAIEGTDELEKQLNENPAVPVDAREFLAARLTDIFVGDWDRHRDQWRWARVSGARGERWVPIPRDRDQAFVRFDGIMPAQARRVAPQLLNFERKYADMTGATWNGRDLDRRFLTGLERPVWDSIAASLKSRFTDQVIANAAGRLPPEYQPLNAASLERTLRARRDDLGHMADDYYRHLAAEVDVHASDKPDEAKVLRQTDGTTTVTLTHQGKEYFRRTFKANETREIRIYLHGGNDRLLVEGDGGSSPTVRVIGGGDDDQYTITARGGVHLYDDKGTNQAQGAGINTKLFDWKRDTLIPNQMPPRDWGKKTFLLLTGYFATDIGAVIDYGGHTDWFGFRRVPYATRLNYRLQYSTGRNALRFTSGLTRQFENSRGFWEIGALASGIETLRWYGVGNETPSTGAKQFYKVNQTQLELGLRLGARFGNRHKFTIGPVVRWSDTDLDGKPNSTRFIAVDQPYGTGQFGMAGVAAELRLDGRDYPGFATKGAYLSVKAGAYPKAWDLDKAMARVEAEGSLALAPQGYWRPSLHLFAGGIKTFGDSIPFFETARLGGRQTLRGYNFDRFAGDAAVYAAAEVRLPLTRLRLILPGQQGVFGFYDAGRVYVRGQDSDEIHTSFGGGVWFSLLTRENLVFVGAGKPAKDKEGTRIIAGFGFPF